MPLFPTSALVRPLRRCSVGHYRNFLQSARNYSEASSAKVDPGFIVNLDVKSYDPKEITVRTIDNQIIIEGKHEEKLDKHGFISRHFIRRYVLPKNVQVEAVTPSLSSDGILTVSAPKVSSEKDNERLIPIISTGKPVIEKENKQSTE